MQTSGSSYNHLQRYQWHVWCPQLESHRKGEGWEQGRKKEEGEPVEKIEKRDSNSQLNRRMESLWRWEDNIGPWENTDCGKVEFQNIWEDAQLLIRGKCLFNCRNTGLLSRLKLFVIWKGNPRGMGLSNSTPRRILLLPTRAPTTAKLTGRRSLWTTRGEGPSSTGDLEDSEEGEATWGWQSRKLKSWTGRRR